ncbi:metallophosphoesterase [Natronolimnobius baerhuensis]|uniref:Metallophosphoesterase n=1 Tax=Natronolimnobius baerhuensis TaxID=253108 RepID=A0A202E8U6_9EURY|nr:metallophosphoesterase [Natronolimnobius baerhuensis]OVE84657.1 metallophosphoesterase [Natronolimnobius baerhuensis]
MTPAVDVEVPFSPLERAAYVPAADTLLLADLHLGRAETSRVEAPIDDGSDAQNRLASLLAQTEPDTVVVAGDLLHAFDRVPLRVARDLEALESTIAEAGASLVVTPGNHDTMLESVFDGETSPEYRLPDGETVVCHGHEEPTIYDDVERYVIGHDHPALAIDGRKRPCVLYGPGVYDGADVLVLPAFTRLAGGATVNRMRARDFQSPLVTDADAFYPAVWDDGQEAPLWFPPLGECRRFL